MSNLPSPDKQIENLLQSSGATLLRTGKHLVYGLPNNKRFTLPGTPGTYKNRSLLNSISNLRRAIGRPAPDPPTAPAFPPVQLKPPAPAPVIAPPPPEPNPPTMSLLPPPAPTTQLHTRIEELIAAAGAAEYNRLIDEAGSVDRYLTMLKSLLPFANDPLTEGLLATLIYQHHPAEPEPAPPPPPPPPPAPPRVSIQITRDRVRDAISFMPDQFTVGDIFAHLSNGLGPLMDPLQRRELQRLIGQQLHYQHKEAGTIQIIQQGRGRGGMSTWGKIDPASLGTRIEITSPPKDTGEPHDD